MGSSPGGTASSWARRRSRLMLGLATWTSATLSPRPPGATGTSAGDPRPREQAVPSADLGARGRMSRALGDVATQRAHVRVAPLGVLDPPPPLPARVHHDAAQPLV